MASVLPSHSYINALLILRCLVALSTMNERARRERLRRHRLGLGGGGAWTGTGLSAAAIVALPSNLLRRTPLILPVGHVSVPEDLLVYSSHTFIYLDACL